ncbi:MAG: ABC transporter permease subunit [Planctomycetes bacterium]|nr:ABC transporter permease subunit [Planctomycetota bacterium]
MNAALHDLGRWFWRLVPANPILVRVVQAGGRRERHLWIRVGYLFILGAATFIGVIITHTGNNASLAELAKSATGVFKWVSLIQLAMVCVLAPVFAAAAITQEKDSQTYNILLSTPLSNAQIVLGSLLSRLYFVIVLLLAGIPLFCILMVYGGVTGDKIAQTIALSAATALLTGTLAISISVIKIGTGRTIFSFYLAIALFLVAIYALSIQGAFIPAESIPAPGQSARMSWLAAFHPFLALSVVLGETPAPDFGSVSHYGLPVAQILAYPQFSFIAITFLLSALLIATCLFFVRRGAKEGEPTFFSRVFRRNRVDPANPNAAAALGDESQIITKKPRTVLKNPIAWRESVTSAAAGGGILTRLLMLFIGLILGLLLVVVYSNGTITLIDARGWLFTLVIIEVGISLFIATTTAATSMTREKESNTLELVLGTPLTSSQIISGKIRGLVYAAGPLLVVPYATAGLFVIRDLVAGKQFGASANPVVHLEVLLTMPILLIAFTMFACMIGLRSSIQQKKTITAVFSAMAVVMAVFGITSICPFSISNTSADPMFVAAFMPITPVTAFNMMFDPENATGPNNVLSGDLLATCRLISAAAAAAVAGVYVLIGWSLHSNMVRSFDMTIRKQSA